MMVWVVLVIGLAGLAASLHSFGVYYALKNSKGRIDYSDYLVNGLCVYLVLPTSLFVISICLAYLLMK